MRMYVCGECVHVVNVGDVGVGDECVGVLCACGVTDRLGGTFSEQIWNIRKIRFSPNNRKK